MNMYFLKNKPDLVHFLKGSGKTFSNTFLAEIKRTYTKWCPFSHGKLTDHACYLIFQHEMGWIEYIRYFAFTVRFILGDSRDYQGLLNLIDKLADPDSNRTKEEFGLNLNKLTIYIKKIEEEIKPKVQALTCLECERIGESISCLYADCFISATLMAASAVEARLHYLINKSNAPLYKKHFKNASLGTLIKLFDEDEFREKEFTELKKIVPKKHQSLLNLINVYRIFSAHPKGEGFDNRLSETIINLSFLFLLDSDLKITDKTLLKPC